MTQVLVHWILDMSGAATFACIVAGCRDSQHRHTRVVRWMIHHRWLTQSVAALAVSVITVRMVG